MKIAIVSTFAEIVPPEKYGGIELVVSNITETLTAMGHEVTLFAPQGSKTSASLVTTLPSSLRAMKLPSSRHNNAAIVAETGRIAWELSKGNFDVVHNHLGWRLLSLEKFIKSPVVTTLHGPLDDPYQKFIYTKFRDSNYVSISLSQREPMPELNYVDNVYNGIDTENFTFHEKPGKYLAFLGRMSPEKGPKVAIEIAKKAGMELKMAAKIDTVDQEYFNKEVKPHIDGKQIQFLGEIDSDQKDDFLGNALALVAPIQWREPFGLFIVEAMATGTPVVVTNMGAAPELMVDGKTGFVVQNEIFRFVDALKKIEGIDRKECYQRAKEHFSKETMTKNYIRVYEKLAGKKHGKKG